MPEKILERMESGMCSWKNIEGDFLLQRLGIPGEYYEKNTITQLFIKK